MHTITRDITGTSVNLTNDTIKWPEILSLGALNAAIAISWIAYLEYQPVLLQRFSLTGLADLLMIAKALILVVIPILSGWASDKFLRKGKYMMVYMTGISATAMIFMIVAGLISLGPENSLAAVLPVMVVLWLIGMAVFIAPAFAMLSAMADKHRLPLAMGVIILCTDLIYAAEPLVIELVRFFGETLTFVVGGILVLGTGYLFYRKTTDEADERIRQTLGPTVDVSTKWKTVIGVAMALGLGRAFLVEYIPSTNVIHMDARSYAFYLLGGAAVIAFASAPLVTRLGIRNVLQHASGLMGVGILMLLLGSTNQLIFITGSIFLALGFGLTNVSGLPYIFSKTSLRQVTTAIGVFLGVSAIAEGLFEAAALL